MMILQEIPLERMVARILSFSFQSTQIELI